MTLTTSIWAASLAGALLFFAAGFLSARRRPLAAGDSPRLEVVPPPPSSNDVDLVALRERLASADALVGEMRQERRRLVARLEAAEAAPAPVEQDVAIELEALRGRAADRDRLADENARLTERVRAMRAEVEQLSARQLARPAPSPRSAATPRQRVRTGGGTEEALESVLRRIGSARGTRAIALADDLGLPIVGFGDDVTSLAAFAGYVDGIGKKATELLPLRDVKRIDVQDGDRATVTLCPMVVDDAHIVLVTLTAGPGPSTPQMERALEGAARMI